MKEKNFFRLKIKKKNCISLNVGNNEYTYMNQSFFHCFIREKKYKFTERKIL